LSLGRMLGLLNTHNSLLWRCSIFKRGNFRPN